MRAILWPRPTRGRRLTRLDDLLVWCVENGDRYVAPRSGLSSGVRRRRSRAFSTEGTEDHRGSRGKITVDLFDESGERFRGRSGPWKSASTRERNTWEGYNGGSRMLLSFARNSVPTKSSRPCLYALGVALLRDALGKRLRLCGETSPLGATCVLGEVSGAEDLFLVRLREKHQLGSVDSAHTGRLIIFAIFGQRWLARRRFETT